MPALRALAEAHPRHQRVLAAPGALAPLVACIPGDWTVVDVAPLAPLPASLRGADVAVNLHGRGPQSHRLLLDAHPRRLLAYAHPDVPESAAGPRWDEHEHEVRRWCRLLESAGVRADPSRLGIVAPPAPAPGLEGATIVHPGAAHAARRWPLERWAQVARAEAASGARVIVTGSAAERSEAERLAQAAGLDASAVWAGRTDPAGLVGLVAVAGLVLSADTGVAHLATALDRPSVVVFGPVPPALWGPPPERSRHRVLWAGLTGDGRAEEPHPGLLRIDVPDVLEAAAAARAAAAGEAPHSAV